MPAIKNLIAEPQIVERCRSISISDLKANLRRLKTSSHVQGNIAVEYDGHWQKWDYLINDQHPNATLSINPNTGHEPQQISLSGQTITFGHRYYFVCGQCGRRAAKLYIPQRMAVFRCRTCYKLKYELQTMNPGTIQGKHFYQTHRMLKLAGQRERMARIFYKGSYTKRFKRFLRLCGRVKGLQEVVSEANDLVSSINEATR